MPLPHEIHLHGGPRDGDTEEVNDPWPRTQLVVDDEKGGTATYYVRYEEPEEADYEENPTYDGIPAEGPYGAVGPEGPQGPEGTEGKDGKEGARGEGFTFLGTYKAGVTYEQGDCVFENGLAYVSVVNENKGNKPSTDSGAHWVQGFTGFTIRGEWTEENSYNPFDIVLSEGSSYICIRGVGTLGFAPKYDIEIVFKEEPHWQLLALAGTPGGEKGEKGKEGKEGKEGPEGKEGKEGVEGPEGPTGPEGPSGGPEGPEGPEGKEGKPGHSVLHGAADPTNEDGEDGDFWINTASYFFFGPKAGGKWPSGVALATGPEGPEGKEGKEGKEGPKGEKGEKGEKGTTGEAGTPGAKGEKGVEGKSGGSTIDAFFLGG